MKHKIFRLIVALTIVIALVVIQAPTKVYAATLTVTNNNDSGPGSLRQAILDASNGDTIDFDADYTITLSSQLPIIDKTLTIIGNGATNTIIESNASPYFATYSAFEIGTTGDLTLESLTIRHGNHGIYNAGILTVINSVVSHNHVYDYVLGIYAGGGIYSVDGTVTIVDSTFVENSSEWGGGIFIGNGTLNVTGSTFIGNMARYGAGLFNYGTSMIANSTFSWNFAEELGTLNGRSRGGGIANANVLTVMNSIFSNNYADDGSGIDNYIGTLTVINTLFSDNIASRNGGGIYNYLGTATIENSTFSGNIADYSEGGYSGGGGGILNWGPMTVTDSVFIQNYSANQGGGILNANLLVVTNSTFSSNNADVAGGGIYNGGGGPATVTNSTFSSNSAQNGGGINNEFGTMTVENSTFSGNSSVSDGGGIQNFETLHLINTIIANSASGADCYNEFGDVIATNINNLIDVNSSAGHMCGTPTLSVNPMLGPLADNGGPTQTMALLEGSPAIDAGDNATCEATDQRGVARPQGAACDIGAFELEVANPTIELSIDIKPGSDLNPINLNGKGKIPVAILSTDDFDSLSMVDVSSLTFGKLGDEESLAFCNDNGEDINGDGLLDLVCHFYTQATGFQIGDFEGVLNGQTVDNIRLEGRDGVTILK